MKHFYVISCFALSLVLPVQAEEMKGDLPDPGDAHFTVPAVEYTPWLNAYIGPSDDQRTPDKNWRAGNDTVGTQPGMGGMNMPNAEHQPANGGKP